MLRIWWNQNLRASRGRFRCVEPSPETYEGRCQNEVQNEVLSKARHVPIRPGFTFWPQKPKFSIYIRPHNLWGAHGISNQILPKDVVGTGDHWCKKWSLRAFKALENLIQKCWKMRSHPPKQYETGERGSQSHNPTIIFHGSFVYIQVYYIQMNK